MRQSSSLIVTLIFLSLLGSSAQGTALEDAVTLVDLWVEEQLEWNGQPGLAVAIVQGQKVVLTRAYGYEDVEARRPMRTSSVFRIGSVSKLFTATAILQLRDEGRLELDDPVNRHLPWFVLEESGDQAPSRPITVRDLLTHTSGLPREGAFPYWTTHVFPTTDELREALPKQRAVFAPGERYKYSNLGMALLGEVVAAASGQPYEGYVAAKIFEPLGMERSAVRPDESLRAEMVTAYLRRMPDGSRATFEYYDTGALAAAANLVSTVEDLARFAALQFEDRPDAILRPSTIREMHRAHWVHPSWKGGRGLGFSLTHREGKTFVTHGGWIGGNRSHLLLVPDEEIAVVVLTNADDASPWRFADRIYGAVAPALTTETVPASSNAETPASWETYTGRYTDPWGWEARVFPHAGSLVLYESSYPPADAPGDGVSRLVPLGPATFELPDGEKLVFELDSEGRVERLRKRYEYFLPVEDSP